MTDQAQPDPATTSPADPASAGPTDAHVHRFEEPAATGDGTSAAGVADDDTADFVADQYARDIAEVSAVEVITTTAVHLMSAAAVKCGLADDPATQTDLAEARKLIISLAGLVTAASPELGDQHARSLRDGLRSLQLAFREASPYPDAVGKGPGEKYTGPVS
ncbi:DUF1844 domain-containing protein [Clavibacter michiganensis]|uniref:DUF1844 domain-containing protein n=1 Tax=Clavibacter michiganensis subsp. michiganensis (strain NCPPB 382) TaxID=443906 RepID=A5CSK4_CLAM3|nr:DUF1844 domain-containing protein [Clavibacter michiganensis]MBF4638920.1 hypothetical protein [Clavibacter michiganensis subsp. michiganensis]MDO4025944.1 DUF1844 domain-containing protein [Clavibacter michiganensis]MDO4032562.1 DUF1844 domain-containing protein [Clavibacter michiganensis]MDO4035729.1 DUF1844 domain-containing protein [Clavibacter michiganensis]MDO4041935.1 DUF1844 domain-containing protein [Clavibacter michiganensis]